MTNLAKVKGFCIHNARNVQVQCLQEQSPELPWTTSLPPQFQTHTRTLHTGHTFFPCAPVGKDWFASSQVQDLGVLARRCTLYCAYEAFLSIEEQWFNDRRQKSFRFCINLYQITEPSDCMVSAFCFKIGCSELQTSILFKKKKTVRGILVWDQDRNSEMTLNILVPFCFTYLCKVV